MCCVALNTGQLPVLLHASLGCLPMPCKVKVEHKKAGKKCNCLNLSMRTTQLRTTQAVKSSTHANSKDL